MVTVSEQRIPEELRGEQAAEIKGARQWVLLCLPVVIPLVLTIAPALMGLDFGSHWDEQRHLYSLHRTVDTGIILPGRYIYPSFCYWVNMALLSPEFATAMADGVDKDGRGAYMNAAIDSHEYLMRARGTFVLLSALSILWVYLTLLFWRKHWLWALVGACALGLSWELNYHMRYIAADAVTMQFASLALLFSVMGLLQKERRVWLILAAGAAGAGTATKYPAGLLLVMVMVAVLLRWERGAGFWNLLRSEIGVCIVFFGIYLIITPGSVLEPFVFLRDVSFHMQYYAKGHASHNVPAGLAHFLGILQYVGVSLFSRHDLTGLLLAFIGVLGLFALIRDSKKMALLVLCVPVLYALYFSRQRVLIVRNLLIMAPFAAVLIGLGFEWLWKTVRVRPVQWGAALVVLACFVLNTWWLFFAAGTIRDRTSDRFLRDAGGYMASNPELVFYLTGRVRDGLVQARVEAPVRVVDSPGDAEVLAFFAKEVFPDATGDNWRVDCPGNFFWDIARVFGPQEVNWLLYTKWPTNERIIIMNADRAAGLGLQIP